jgi:hypothetical protein
LNILPAAQGAETQRRMVPWRSTVFARRLLLPVSSTAARALAGTLPHPRISSRHRIEYAVDEPTHTLRACGRSRSQTSLRGEAPLKRLVHPKLDLLELDSRFQRVDNRALWARDGNPGDHAYFCRPRRLLERVQLDAGSRPLPALDARQG